MRRLFGIIFSFFFINLLSGEAKAGYFNSFEPTTRFSGTWSHEDNGPSIASGPNESLEPASSTPAPVVQQSELVAFFDKFHVPADSSQSAKLVVFRVLGSAPTMHLSVQYHREILGNGTIELNFPEISLKNLTLHWEERRGTPGLECYFGTDTHYEWARLCYNMYEFQLTLKGASTLDTIQLKRQEIVSRPLHFDLTMDLVVGRAKFFSHEMTTQAHEVFRVRREIDFAFSELAPKLNGRSIAILVLATAYDLTGFAVFDLFNDLCGWIYPSYRNEYRDSKFAFEAQRDAFKHAQADQMFLVQSYYFAAQRASHLEKFVRKLRTEIDAVSEELNEAGRLAMDSWKAKLELKEHHYREEKVNSLSELAFATDYDILDAPKFNLADEITISLDGNEPLEVLDAVAMSQVAKKNSYRIKELEDKKKSAERQTKSARFAWCRPNEGIYCTLGTNPLSPAVEVALAEEQAIMHEIRITEDTIDLQCEKVARQIGAYIHEYRKHEKLRDSYQAQAEEKKRSGSYEYFAYYADLAAQESLEMISTHHNLMAVHALSERLTYGGKYFSNLMRGVLNSKHHLRAPEMGEMTRD